MNSSNKNRRNEEPNTKGDRLNIALLTFLYTLQFIPQGLIQAIPLILQNRKATYRDQAKFSIVSYSYGFKLLFAPIVDCIFSRTMGRRKTWLIPTQYLLGILLLLISINVDNWLGSGDGTRVPQMRFLIFTFSIAILLSAVQDIVVDGWSLTMLQKRNVGYASTCNHIGTSVGTFLGFVPLTVLDSKEFANSFRNSPQDRGFATLSDLMTFWCLILLVSTTLIWVFKRDNSLDDFTNSSECRLGFQASYRLLWRIGNIKPVRKISFIFFTCFMSCGAINGVARLKLMDAGVPRDKFALMTVPSIPFVLVIPFLFSRYLNGLKSMQTFLFTYILRLLLGILYAIFIFLTPYAMHKEEKQKFPAWYYWLLLLIYNLDHMIDFLQILAAGAFVRRKCDPKFGGTYITILSVVAYIGKVWPANVCLWLVDLLTVKLCFANDTQKKCDTIINGFIVEMILCTLIGSMWFYWGKRQIHKLENTDQRLWLVNQEADVKDNILLSNNIS